MQKVLVRHEPRYNESGNALGLSFRKAGQVVQGITHHYLHKCERGYDVIKTTSGDVWSVMPVVHNEYQFVTV